MPNAVIGRIEQGLAGLFPRLPRDRDALIDRLNPPCRSAFTSLPAYDQAHLCAVCRWLLDRGETDDDLLTAALLHDLGKGALGGRVRLLNRTTNVVLARFAPSLLARLARLPAPRWQLGLALAVHHPALGAEWVRSLGCSERVCWLIAHHADEPPPDDHALRRLIEADERA